MVSWINKSETWVLKNKDRVLFAMILNVILVAGLLILFRPIYETNDDITLCNIVDGSWGTYSPNLVYINRLLGYLLSGLYKTFGVISWYAVLHYAVLFFSFCAITNVVLHKIDSLYKIAVLLIFLCVFGFETYLKIQFTKTAGVATAAGVLLLLEYISGEFRSKIRVFFGYLLALAGFMYRTDQFLLTMLLLSGIGVMILFDGKGRDWIKKIMRAFVLFVPLLVLAMGLYFWDRSGYTSDEWRSYMEYNSVRGELYDFLFPDWNTFHNEYKELGIDAESYNFYRLWNHLDDDYFSVDTMKKLIAMREQNKPGRNWILEFFTSVPQAIPYIPCFCGVIAFLVFWVFGGKHRLSEYIGIIYEIVITGVVYFYLFYQGRYLINRVDVGIWFAFCLVMLWGKWQKTKRGNLWRAFGCVLGLGCFIAGIRYHMPGLRWQGQMDLEKANQNRQQVEELLSSDKETLYLNKAIDVRSLYGPFDRVPEGMFENVAYLCGWMVKMPQQNALLQKYNIQNPYRDVIDRKDVRIVSRNIDYKLYYIQTHFNRDARAELVKDMGEYGIYRIYTK